MYNQKMAEWNQLQKLDKLKRIEKYNINPNLCEWCKKPLHFEKRNNRFCSSKCCGYLTNKENPRIYTLEYRKKISAGVKKYNQITGVIKKEIIVISKNRKIRQCINCKKTIPNFRKFCSKLCENQFYKVIPHLKESICVVCSKKFEGCRLTCSPQCRKVLLVRDGTKGGIKSASKRVLRSSQEIKLFELLNSKYKCLHNVQMFDGFDADIIIPDLKLAIMWNGIWHYEKVTKQHSLLQVQKRDEIRISKIIKHGYNYITVKDHNNKMTPQKAFILLEDCILKNNYNLVIS